MNVNRRNFLKMLGAAPLVATLPNANALWLPESAQGELILPPPPSVVDAVNDEALLYGYLMTEPPPEGMERELVGDALTYFPLRCEVLLLVGAGGLPRGVRRGFARFVYKGSKLSLPGGVTSRIAMSWPNTGYAA